MSLPRGLATPLLRALRRFGRPVHWTPAGVNLGNYLYLWQHASSARRAGVPESVLVHEPAVRWLEVFPALRELSVRPAEVRLRDQRILEPDQSEFGVDFSAADVDRFVGERLLTSRQFTEALDRARTPGELTVNVRRGDYYADARFRSLYGFDQVAYVRVAVGEALSSVGTPESIRVVSDGLDWCREHLAWLEDLAPTRFGSVGTGPVADLAQISGADTLVVTNSTFSYWGAHITRVRSEGASAVWAPWFGRRDIDGGRAWQLDPAWHVVRDLPDGWAEPAERDPVS